MKPSIFLLALAVITITSCTSAYKTGQTPDDVYFSPQKPQAEYVAANNRDDDPGYYNGNDYYGDRYLRMKVQNRYQWSDLDDYYYTDRYSYGGFGGYSYYNSGLYLNNPWSPVSYWNYYYNPYYSSFYNPYYSPIFVIGNKGNGNGYTVTNRPRMFNLNTYNNNQLTNGNYTNRRFDFNTAPTNVNSNNYNNNYRNSRTNAGGFLRNAFGSGNNNNNNSNDNSRSYNNTNNNSSSSGGRSSGGSSSGGSSSGGGSAPVRKF